MGVTGLLPQLKEIQEPITLERYRGKTLAIDSYSWLHKSVMSCSWELAQDIPTLKYLSYFKKKIQMLKHFDINPYFVFDGDDFKSKEGTELERAQSRSLNKQKGLELLNKGDRKGAGEYFMKSVEVTPSMAKTIIEHLKIENIDYVVAPYEADAQLVYLEKIGLVDGIISEDSDLLIFGAKALLTKLNDNAECIQILRDQFKMCRSVPIGLMNDSQLRMVACLSGCDYTNGIPGIGIVKAIRLVKRLSQMKKCLMSLRLEGKVRIPDDFELDYAKADLSFQYQRVFDPITKQVTTLNEIKQQDLSNELLEGCIGHLHESEIHHGIAIGDLDPITKSILLPREDSIKSMSQPLFINTPSKVTSYRQTVSTSKKLITTPVDKGLKLKPTITSIDSFFKTKITSQTISRSRSLPTPTLSPTTKRRRMFNPQDNNSTQGSEKSPSTQMKSKPITSKFFKNSNNNILFNHLNVAECIQHEEAESKGTNLNLMLVKPVLNTIEDTNDKDIVAGTTKKRAEIYGTCAYSSEFELSDIDDEGENSNTNNKENELEGELHEMGYVFNEGNTVGEEEEETTAAEMEEIPTGMDRQSISGARIMEQIETRSSAKEWQDRPSKVKIRDVKRGLFERYGLKDTTNTGTNTKVSIMTSRNSMNNNRNCSVTGKQLQGLNTTATVAKVKPLTLDSFIYRGT